MEGEILKDNSRSHLIHWVEWTYMKSTCAQQGASFLWKTFCSGEWEAMCFGTATIQTYHCRDRVRCISYLFSLVPMDKWKGKLKGHNLKSDRDRMQAACWKMRSKNERRKKIRGRQANKRLLLTLVSMSVTLTSLSSSTTFTMRYYIVASLRSLLCSVMTDITAWWSKSIQRTWQTTVFFALWLKTLK